MGYPGTTYKFFTADEVTEWSEIDNNIRIEMRGILQDVMLREMLADPKINIMYAAKYASSQNGYKRAQGANWAIRRRSLREIKLAQQQEVLAWAKQRGIATTEEAVRAISKAIEGRQDLRMRQRYLLEGILMGIEMSNAPTADSDIAEHWNDPARREAGLQSIRKQFEAFFNKDYSPEVEKALATALLTRYAERIPAEKQPISIREGIAEYGSAKAYV